MSIKAIMVFLCLIASVKGFRWTHADHI